MFNHAHFNKNEVVRLTLRDGTVHEGRVIDLYYADEKQYMTLVKQGSFFHHLIALDTIQSSELVG